VAKAAQDIPERGPAGWQAARGCWLPKLQIKHHNLHDCCHMVNASTMMASAQTQGGSPWTFGHCWPPVTQIKHDYLEKKKKEQEKKKRQHKKENTMPFGINLMRSQGSVYQTYGICVQPRKYSNAGCCGLYALTSLGSST